MTKLLLVEDDKAWAEIAMALLNRVAADANWDLKISVAHTWSEASHRANRYDAILLDLQLPDSDYHETLDRLDECCHSLPPVILITGYPVEPIRRRAFKFGAQDIVWKGELTTCPMSVFHRIMHAIWRNDYLHAART